MFHTAGKGSARIDPYVSGSENVAREIDGAWLNVNPGDHIVFTCWMKVQTSPGTLYYPQCGARIGIDFYGNSGRIQGKQSTGQTFYPNEDNTEVRNNWVCDTNGGIWQQRTIDVVVPTILKSDSDGSYYTPIAIIPWMQASPESGSTQSSVWFADPVLVRN